MPSSSELPLFNFSSTCFSRMLLGSLDPMVVVGVSRGPISGSSVDAASEGGGSALGWSTLGWRRRFDMGMAVVDKGSLEALWC